MPEVYRSFIRTPRIVSKAVWPGLFNEAFEASVTTGNITSGFQACGIFPFNANALSHDLLLPSTDTGTGQDPEEQQKTKEEKQKLTRDSASTCNIS